MGTIQLQQQEMMRLHHGINGSGRQSGMRSCHSPLVGTGTSSSGAGSNSGGPPLFLGGGNWSHVYRPPPCGRWVTPNSKRPPRFLLITGINRLADRAITTAAAIRTTTRRRWWWSRRRRRPNRSTPTPPFTASAITKMCGRPPSPAPVSSATTCETIDSSGSKWSNQTNIIVYLNVQLVLCNTFLFAPPLFRF